MIRQMFYHCATTADKKNSKNIDTTTISITSLFIMTILMTLKTGDITFNGFHLLLLAVKNKVMYK